MTDLSTWFVQSNNETMEWCSDITKDLEYGVYRPLDTLLASRNTYLHQVMHNRSHQPTY